MRANRMRRERQWSRLLACVIALLSLAGSVAYLRQPLPSDIDARAALAAYGPALALIPPDARVGLVDFSGSNSVLFLAQYVLVPRVIDGDLAQASFVVTSPGASPSADSDPRLAEFQLIDAAPSGVRLYRRK
jgi:hypothetical protein